MTGVRQAQRSGAASHVIRYYTRLGLLHPLRDRGNGYRAYAESDVQRVRFIRRTRWLGFNLIDLVADGEGRSGDDLLRDDLLT